MKRTAATEAFKAEIAETARLHREAFLAHRGDGMAVKAVGFMNDVRELKSALHGPHTLDSACLESVATVPDVRNGVIEHVAAEGWYRCQQIGVHLHDHGSHLMSHCVLDRAGCPKVASTAA